MSFERPSAGEPGPLPKFETYNHVEGTQPEVKTVETPFGPVSFIVHQGINKEFNHDRAVIVSLPAENIVGFAVVDGAPDEAHDADQILAEEARAIIEKNHDLTEINQVAHQRMKKEALLDQDWEAGAAYVALRLLPDPPHRPKLEVAHAGDARAVVYDRLNAVTFATEDHNAAAEGKPHTLTNAVTPHSPGYFSLATIRVGSGDRVVLATDALWKNLTNEEVGEILSRHTHSADAVRALNDTLMKKMQATLDRYKQDPTAEIIGSPDNISIITLDVRLSP